MSDHALEHHQQLVQALLDPARYPHPVERVSKIETHISTVLLAGDFVYKLKKPVNFGFLDFTALAQRGFFCAEELRLNRRLAPGLYLDVVTLTGTPDHPQFNGAGEPLEYAVCMRRFDQAQILDQRLKADKLPLAWMDQLAAQLVPFHQQAAVATLDSPLGEPEAVYAPMQQNFDQLRQWLKEPALLAELDALEHWTQTRYQALKPLLAERKQHGYVRECHGDLHLGNIAWVDEAVLPFDGIEFNEAFRWIDVSNEVAFLLMDLEDRGAFAHARRFLNAWLEYSGDYAALPLLRFYQVYRAMVRAKVAAIRLTQSGLSSAEQAEITAHYQSYVRLAQRFTQPTQAALVITHGFSGSGKTTQTQTLVEALGMVRIRSDIERKRLANLAPTQRATAAFAQGLYSPEQSAKTYERLAELAETALQAGYPTLVDATFLQAAQRRRFIALAQQCAVPVEIIDFVVAPEVLKQRVAARSQANQDASDADVAVLLQQMQQHEPLQADEPVTVVDETTPLPVDALGRKLNLA
ncbi:AAA family ATPase [Thiorhodospira sibirica]|uniref:bifunctional aminoglycoside phosphotransferase/ATP-binding protein n=1 Tax=Thiorhodospira sibirica TaxID=154347 RepID=UPI0003089AF7|nr:bifunctional aminoglycoside phosphotransferase/ATP-binding protein [Thiorhodospira sibirica]